jgi:GTP-binding protein
MSKALALRNVAIIAHVDHGKTTMVDQLLKVAGSFRENEEVAERVMDSDAIERERGITIFSKNAAVQYKDNRINIVDTPGHADFGGQVERVLGTVDGVLLIVDAWEGPMAQTRFVTSKALALGLKVIVVINKIDRDGCQPEKAVDKVFDLFCELGATDEQLSFPHIYASGRAGTCRLAMDQEDTDLAPLLDMILEHIPNHTGDKEAAPLMQISSLSYDPYLGRMVVGRLLQGTIKVGDFVNQSRADGTFKKSRIQKIMHFEGIGNVSIEEAEAGDIISMAGIADFDIGDTICGVDNPVAMERIILDPPTISMLFSVNDSPLAGKSGGKFINGNHIQERLERANMADPALRVEKTDGASEFKVSGRGVLHITILIENMRRELYEFSVGAPRVLYKKDEDGKILEPCEILTVNVPGEYAGAVIEELGKRRGEMTNMETDDNGQTVVSFKVPSRGLIGLRAVLLSQTRGYAVMQTLFEGYIPYLGEMPSRQNGALISLCAGPASGYAIYKLQDRGVFIIPPTTEVYEGMIIGENNRSEDIVVNVIKGKQLTNMRASGSDDATTVTPHRQMTLEDCITFINDDELVEVTPECLRIRKEFLTESQRRQNERSGAKVLDVI